MSGDLSTIPDRQLARQLGDALRALARVEDSRRPRAAALNAARERVEELRREMGARLIDGRWTAWDSLGVRAAPAERRTGGSVYEDKSRNRWIAELTVNGSRARKVCGSKDEATRWLADARQRAADGRETRESRWTVAGWCDHLLDDVWPRTLRPRTLENHRHALDSWWRPNVGDMRLTALRTADVDRVIARMVDGGLSPNSTRINTAVMIKALNQAVDQDIVQRNVAAAATRPRIEAHESKFLTPEETRTLLAACFDAPMGDPIALALLLGLRRGELLGLAWDRVQLDGPRPTLTVNRMLTASGGLEPRTKTGQKGVRTIVLPTAAADVLRRRRERQRFEESAADGAWRNEHGLVFTNAIGEPLRPDAFTKAVSKLTLRVVGRPIHPHALRHTAATAMAEAGVPPKVVQAILGHSTPLMTLGTYTHVLDEQHDRAAEALDALLSG